jgi:hypothetical protein
MNNDTEHLRLLSIFHYIHAGLVAFYSMLALIYVAMGIMLIAAPDMFESGMKPTIVKPPVPVAEGRESNRGDLSAEDSATATVPTPTTPPIGAGPGISSAEMPPELMKGMGIMVMGFGLIFMLLGLGFAFASYLTGRFLARRQHHTFCIVVSAIDCLSFPIGTLLGVFTLIVLFRPSVKQLFTA